MVELTRRVPEARVLYKDLLAEARRAPEAPSWRVASMVGQERAIRWLARLLPPGPAGSSWRPVPSTKRWDLGPDLR